MKLTDEEYNVVNKIASLSKMDCWFWLETDELGNDYVRDIERNNQVMQLDLGIKELYDGMTDLNDYDLTRDEKETFKKLVIRLGIAEEFEFTLDLNNLLNFINKGKEIDEIDGEEWKSTYGKLISFLYAVGRLTEKREEIERVIAVLDEIDTLGY